MLGLLMFGKYPTLTSRSSFVRRDNWTNRGSVANLRQNPEGHKPQIPIEVIGRTLLSLYLASLRICVQVGLWRWGHPWALGGGSATPELRFIPIRFLLKSPDQDDRTHAENRRQHESERPLLEVEDRGPARHSEGMPRGRPRSR